MAAPDMACPIEWAPPTPGTRPQCRGRPANAAVREAAAHAKPTFSERRADAFERPPPPPRSPSSAILFPLSTLPSWADINEELREVLAQTNGEKGRSLSFRLQQAERNLAEKDLRIEALEARTSRLAERLALAEGLAAPSKEPGTPCSTRSTSDSTAWHSEGLTRRNTLESLGSLASLTSASKTSTVSKPSGTTQASKTRGATTQVPSDKYATEAEVDAVCRRCEQLLKSMTAVVQRNERLARRKFCSERTISWDSVSAAPARGKASSAKLSTVNHERE
ncbi:unnamed protein product [Effrenium voratum]|nr:unnamed protein product [Effrenium voratum]